LGVPRPRLGPASITALMLWHDRRPLLSATPSCRRHRRQALICSVSRGCVPAPPCSQVMNSRAVCSDRGPSRIRTSPEIAQKYVVSGQHMPSISTTCTSRTPHVVAVNSANQHRAAHDGRWRAPAGSCCCSSTTRASSGVYSSTPFRRSTAGSTQPAPTLAQLGTPRALHDALLFAQKHHPAHDMMCATRPARWWPARGARTVARHVTAANATRSSASPGHRYAALSRDTGVYQQCTMGAGWMTHLANWPPAKALLTPTQPGAKAAWHRT
jgi:hypothetical protein